MKTTHNILLKKYSEVKFDNETNYIRVYDVKDTKEVVKYLYDNKIIVNEAGQDKISLEEYYINLMNKGGQ